MLDELLGRASLKSEIDELESTIKDLESQLEAEQSRRAEAVSDRQAANEEVNRLEDRIADLEGQLDRARGDEQTLSFRGTDRLRGRRLEEALDRLDSFRTGPEGALTAMVDEVPDPVRSAFGERAALLDRAAPCLALTDDLGLVSVLLDPPLPPSPFVAWGEGFEFDRAWFLPSGSFSIALVRADLFAFGTYEGKERIEFEGFQSDVMGDHSKGGFSQARFERRREEQVDTHLDRCRSVVEERAPERLLVVGERRLIGEFADRAIATIPVDATGAPEEALDDAFEDVFVTKLYRI